MGYRFTVISEKYTQPLTDYEGTLVQVEKTRWFRASLFADVVWTRMGTRFLSNGHRVNGELESKLDAYMTWRVAAEPWSAREEIPRASLIRILPGKKAEVEE